MFVLKGILKLKQTVLKKLEKKVDIGSSFFSVNHQTLCSQCIMPMMRKKFSRFPIDFIMTLREFSNFPIFSIFGIVPGISKLMSSTGGFQFVFFLETPNTESKNITIFYKIKSQSRFLFYHFYVFITLFCFHFYSFLPFDFTYILL